MVTEQTYPSGIRRWLIIITVMAAMLMQLLDTTIANVALPHMQAALGATADSIAWVLTSYIIMAAIMTPITGWLESRLGRRALFGVAIASFTVSSAACGLATSLTMMVVSRALQGSFGALIAPLAMSTMLDSSPREKHPQALMIFTMGITTGPIMGPVLGGWLTDNYNWRWIFFINLPIGIIASVAIFLLLDKKSIPRQRFDLLGFALLGLGLASLQLMLDRGTQKDWFDSPEIIIEAGVSISALWMFVIHILATAKPLLPLALFRDRNYVLAVLFTVLITGIAMSGQALMAPMLQSLMGYDVMGAGLMMAPRGMGALIVMPLVTMLGRRVDPRILIGFGMALVVVSQTMMTGFDLDMGKEPIVYATFLQGIGMGFTFLPLNILAFSTIAPQLRTEGAAFYNLARNMAGSVAISLMTLLIARNLQVSHSDLGAHIGSTSVPVIGSTAIAPFGVTGGMVMHMVDGEINRQAMMIAYLDDFWLMKWAALIMLPLILLMRRAKPGNDQTPIMLE